MKGEEGKKKHIFFTSPPSHSHVVILRELAVGLQETFPDKYRITFGTSGKFLKMIEDVGLESYNIGGNKSECQEMPSHLVKAMTNVDDPIERFRNMGIGFVSMYECQFDPHEAFIAREKPDLVVAGHAGIVVDFFQQAAIDLCNKYHIELITTGSLGAAGFEDRIWLPNMMVGGPLSEMHSLTKRFDNFVFAAQRLLQFKHFAETINAPRIARGLPPAQISDTWSGRLVLCPEPWMFHSARPVSPTTQMIGFVSPPVDSPRSAALTDPAKDAEIISWLDHLSESVSVIYVAFGSHAHVPQETLDSILSGLLANPDHYVLVGLRPEVEVKLNVKEESALKRLRREAWLPQRRVLDHPKVKLFVSHGGLTSVAESVDAEKPLLIIPFMGDQPRNGFLLQDAGVGKVIRKKDVTPAAVETAANAILTDYQSFKAAVVQLKGVSEFAGGRKRAAELIDHQIRFGSQHLINVEKKFTIIERYNLDILAIFLVILFILFHVVKKIVWALFCRRSTKEKQQ